jgi:hypothetical protein
MAGRDPKATTGDVHMDALVFSIVDVLQKTCGYAGLAIGPGTAMINTTNPVTKSDYIIKFDVKPPETTESEVSQETPPGDAESSAEG